MLPLVEGGVYMYVYIYIHVEGIHHLILEAQQALGNV